MLNISKDEKRYTEIELDLHKKLAYEKGRASIIEELEKIKEEIKDLDLGFFDEDYRAGIARGIMEFNKILNKHIKELKGESNGID